VEFCGKCRGVWLDEGKVYKFTKQPEIVARAFKVALKKARPASLASPKTQKPMQEIPLLGEKLTVEYCPDSQGLWFADGKLATLGRAVFKQPAPSAAPKTSKTAPVSQENAAEATAAPEPAKTKSPPAEKPGTAPRRIELPPLPELEKYSRIPLAVTYGVLLTGSAILVFFTPLSVAMVGQLVVLFALVQFLFSPWIIDKFLENFVNINWVDLEELPSHLREFLKTTCQKEGMEIPRIGVIFDGAPNAFSYGLSKNKARIIVTKGLAGLLNSEEVEAVMAHEIGHIRAKDMSVMTAFQVIPLLFGFMYHSLVQTTEGGVSGKKAQTPPPKKGKASKGSEEKPRERVPGKFHYMLASLTYYLYVLFESVVLAFSRTRELYADQFAAKATGKPNVLASALVKIAYGLAGVDKKVKTVHWCEACQVVLTAEQIYNGLCRTCDRPITQKELKRERRKPVLEAIGAFGLMDPRMARAFTAANFAKVKDGRHFDDPVDMKPVSDWVKWELDNPWSIYYESVSTHPLLVRRWTYLGEQARNLGQKPFIPKTDIQVLNDLPDDFKNQVFKNIAPALFFFVLFLPALLTFRLWLLGIPMVATGVALFMKLRASYYFELFPLVKIRDLMQKNDLTQFDAEPCKIAGHLVGPSERNPLGKGNPVLRDDSGMVLLDYSSPGNFWKYVFSVFRGQRFEAQEVVVTGWFRRAPVPQVEVKSLKVGNQTRVSGVYKIQMIAAWLLIVGGILAFATVGLP